MPDDPWESSGYNVWAARSLRQVERGLPSVLGGLTEPALSGLGIKGQRSGLDKPFDQIGGALDLLWVQPLFHQVPGRLVPYRAWLRLTLEWPDHASRSLLGARPRRTLCLGRSAHQYSSGSPGRPTLFSPSPRREARL